MWDSYRTLGNLLCDLGVNESEEKAVPPAQMVKFLRILYDLVNMVISVLQDKLHDLKLELKKWVKKKDMNKKMLQQITGNLQFAASGVRSGRVFVNRLYDVMSYMCDVENVWYNIPQEVRKDLGWWNRFLKQYNGSSIM